VSHGSAHPPAQPMAHVPARVSSRQLGATDLATHTC